ncbi:hypothetical protein D9613_012164 [Agrocybe pediades]|uniref:Uncharacterized protein n=1 Tax=Agrocybe pediades TaxID=84607 RepID=A0A8H4R420_9AGAR|nr:hypothetical protein D9613_012164 [Agrocybe pediades]
MKTKVNPVYSVFIAHKDPMKCTRGALAFLIHYLFDLMRLIEKADIDFSLNKTWRQIRVLHGQRSPTMPFNEQALYNLFVNAFHRASFISRLKRRWGNYHTFVLLYSLPNGASRVDPSQTARMGWTRGNTYFDTYAPAFPKEAILGTHGYKVHEVYDPVWRHVPVPQHFLEMMCPMAESIHEQVVGKPNLLGASNFWEMVISLRPFLFQCGAAIFQECPESNIFRLPALANRDVQNWMKTEYPTQLMLLNASRGSEIDLARLQDGAMKQILSSVVNPQTASRSEMQADRTEMQSFMQMVSRRLSVLSPSKYSHDVYHRTFERTSNFSAPQINVSQSRAPQIEPSTPPRRPLPAVDDTAVYATPSGALRAFVNCSPKTPITPRARSDVDLVLPPVEAFFLPNEPRMIFPPLFGQHSITWEQVFKLVKRPEYTLEEQWRAYNSGEYVVDEMGNQTGVKPPLREVEKRWKAQWRREKGARKAWERFIELPIYILKQCEERSVPPEEIIKELEQLRKEDNGRMKGLSALSKLIKARREENIARKPASDCTGVSNGTDSTVPDSTKTRKRKAPVEIRRHPGEKHKAT